MGRADIRDNRSIRKEMDIAALTPQAMEKLLCYIGLREGDVPIHEMD